MGNCVRDNPLRARSDVERAAVQLIEPLLPLLSPNKARLHLGDTGAVYPDDIAQMEAFARPLWAIVPMLAGHCASVKPLWAARGHYRGRRSRKSGILGRGRRL